MKSPLLPFLVVIGWMLFANEKALHNGRNATFLDHHSSESKREPRLGDDCLFVYLDVGANIGVHTRFLFEPALYPDAKTARSIFDNHFGGASRDNRDICSFGFEPNPAHKKRHQELEKAYEKMGWRYKYIQAGASDQDGNLTFWHKDSGRDKAKEEWGFSTFNTSAKDIPEVVPLLHLSRWIQHHIIERKLPTQIYGQHYTNHTKQEGKVVMKLDIEGSEYQVLPNLLFTGTLCKGVDFAFGEDHPRYSKFFERPAIDPQTRRGAIQFQSKKDKKEEGAFKTAAKEFLREPKGLVGNAFMSVHPNDCKTTWKFLDDESYVHDGMPFPTPPTKSEANSA